uniref:Piwi domain-containing protein n=1 Tax=Ditylenchus dipsaci TaxID=166011 RepID=A0A915DGU7_9BILA
MAITEEYAAIQAGLKKRFFSKKSNQPAENCPPGSVIQNPFSSRLVENLISEAWMVSHKAVKTKCTNKAVQYALLKDEIGIGMGDPLLAFLNSLCYSHQISNGAISLPEPIYQADALAGRGAKNYGCLKKNDPTDIPGMNPPMEKSSLLNSTRFTA